jgi:hypothetical protein
MRYSDENVTNSNSKLTLLTLFLNVLLIFIYLFVLYFVKMLSSQNIAFACEVIREQ